MQPSWANDFLHFSSTQRTHRRSVSDTVAFLELPAAEDKEAFELDDFQLMSIFSDDVAGEPLPGNIEKEVLDQNSVDEKKKGEMHEAETKVTPEFASDPKRVKRILANRQSAQRSRVRKLQYISELERNVTYLQMEVSALSPRVAFVDHQRSALTISNSALRQRIAALSQDKIFKDAHQEALKKEIERLSQIYHHQSLKMMASNGTTPTLTITGTVPIDPVSYIEKDQLVS